MLNKCELSGKHLFYITSVLISAVLIFSLSCGKRKPPQPSTERVVQRTEISALQRGNIVTITCPLPATNAGKSSILNIDHIDIYRLAEPFTAPLSLSEDEFASRSILISSVQVTEEDFRRGQLTFSDNLQFAGQIVRLRYAVRFVNTSGQKASFSNFLLIEPTAKIADKPISVSTSVTEKAIKINWKAPDKNVDGSTPANILGYNIYRSDKGTKSSEILNSIPITQPYFDDRSFLFGKTYTYFVRTISLGGNGEPIESLDSTPSEVSPVDIFAPSAPVGITIAAAPNNLSLFFAANSEEDIAGYRIYRSTNSAQPISEWTLLTRNLLTGNIFQDTTVESGKNYFYFVTAVDKTGNISQRSDIISETAP